MQIHCMAHSARSLPTLRLASCFSLSPSMLSLVYSRISRARREHALCRESAH